MEKDYKLIEIFTTKLVFRFTGIYRRDLEKPNWHYYERHDGELIHIRKDHMIAICDGSWAGENIEVLPGLV